MTIPIPNRDNVQKILVGMPEFQNFSPEQIHCLAYMRLHRWETGMEIIQEGAGDSPMVILLTGRVTVEKRVAGGGLGYERLNEINAPAIIGENAFFTGLPRSVTVKAEGNVVGILLGREEFFGLGNLSRTTMLDFLRKMGVENLKRVDQQVDRFISTIQIMGGQLRKNDLNYFDQVITYKTELAGDGIDLKTMAEVIKEIFVLLRNVNESLQNLFNFANMEDLLVQKVDPDFFNLDSRLPFHNSVRTLVGQVVEMATLLPLDQIQVKNILTNILLDQFRGDKLESRANYANFLKILTDAYTYLLSHGKSAGMILKPMALKQKHE